MIFANCSVIEMIDHSKGLRNVKNISIAKKLPVLFVAMKIIPVASVGVMSYVQISITIESDAIAEVAAVEEPMGRALDKQFDLIVADLLFWGITI